MSLHTMTEVSCSCRTCNKNAEKLGLPAPLKATVTEAFVAKCGAHAAVYQANDPVFGPAFRALQARCASL